MGPNRAVLDRLTIVLQSRPVAIRDILRHTGCVAAIFLEHKADLAPQFGEGKLLDVVARNANAPG